MKEVKKKTHSCEEVKEHQVSAEVSPGANGALTSSFFTGVVDGCTPLVLTKAKRAEKRTKE